MFTRFAAKAIAAALTAATAALSIAPAHAADLSDAQSRTVSYADLDLTTDSGAATLKRRINHAATAVCGGTDRMTLQAMSERATCRAAALASAEPQMQIVFAQASRGERFADAGKAVIRLGAR